MLHHDTNYGPKVPTADCQVPYIAARSDEARLTSMSSTGRYNVLDVQI